MLCSFQPINSIELLKVVNGLVNKQSKLDVIPCTFLKKLTPELIPALLKIINASLTLGEFPLLLKTGTVTPVLKSSNLDKNEFNNYRPVSNLSLLSKILEKCVLKQLANHLETNELYPNYQSAYRQHHSCETALVKIIDDVLVELNPNTYIIMTFLDFSAAFDTVDHNILINRLKNDYGIIDVALHWFKSYLSCRNYKVKINNTLSDSQSLDFGVPQGSILGPILYMLYVKEIEEIAKRHNVNVHIYADDVQLYAPYDVSSDFANLKSCLQEIKLWTGKNYLKLNNKKTQLLCITSKNYTHQIPRELYLMGESITVGCSAKYLGVWLDQHLTFKKQINHVCAQGYRILKNLWKISSKVTDIKIRTQLIHSCILSKLNFCNGIYISLPKKELFKLDKLLKAGVRFIFHITGIKRRQPMTPFLQKLHFLPIKYRLDFKICLLVYKCFKNLAPNYLKELIIPRKDTTFKRTRLDFDKTWLNPHPLEKLNYKSRCFRYAAPSKWNQLTPLIRESKTIEIFKTKLKTFYFNDWIKIS